MLATQDSIEELARRIEQAYALRRSFWHPGCSAPQVWTAAAVALLQLHENDPTLPIDPELYVAAQAIGSSVADPWAELTQPFAVSRYRKCVRQIVRGLRHELRRELRRATRQIRTGADIRQVLLADPARLSPLGRYILANRLDRSDLAEEFRAAAAEQHRSCPLYQQASRGLLPSELYPASDDDVVDDSRCTTRLAASLIHLN